MNFADLSSPPENAVLNYEQCREWLQMKDRPFADAVRSNRVPHIKALGQKDKKFHVRTVLKKLRQETV